MINNTATPIHWRAVWQLIKPYWHSAEKWRAWAMLLAIILLSLATVYISVLLNEWNRVFYDALENKNFPVFKTQLLHFSYLAFAFILISIYKIYLTQGLQMRWRSWMTRQYMDKWLHNHAYYHTEQQMDNPDQRIADDLNALTTGTLSLALGLLSSVVTLFSFVTILWTVSGPITLMIASHSLVIPGYMLWFALLYAIVGSCLVGWIGKPLVKLGYNQEWFEANFRFGLVRIREHSDAIALYEGENSETQQLTRRFESIRSNWWQIMKVTKRLNITATFYSQFATIFPFIVAGPRYFSGAIELGLLMQISSAFGQVQSALSWFVDAFTELASWKACVNRLAGFNRAIEQANHTPRGISLSKHQQGCLQLQDVTLSLPNGQQLCHHLSATVKQGERILISGPSGCGKSTLLRAIAGIWPYGAGNIARADNLRYLFLPQRSYLPIATLRESLCYPATNSTYSEQQLLDVLQRCQLTHLQPHLQQTANWSQQLSPGEQQRLAFARVLLIKPDVLFLDEATSALDDDTEQKMYQLLTEALPDSTIISVAHRNTVAKYHHDCWKFSHQDNGQSLMTITALMA
jgi:putative ATP-binding cassette transporter